MRNRKFFYAILLVIFVLILAIVVAYAALSATLNISFNTVTQNKLTWSIGFDGGTTTTFTANVDGTSMTGLSCGYADIVSTNSIYISSTTMSKPGDKCTYALKIKNSGSIGAKLSSITPTRPSGISCSTASGGRMVCGNITYKLATTSAGTTTLTTGTTIPANTTSSIYLIVEYTGTTLNSSAVTHSGASFSLNYAQA